MSNDRVRVGPTRNESKVQIQVGIELPSAHAILRPLATENSPVGNSQQTWDFPQLLPSAYVADS